MQRALFFKLSLTLALVFVMLIPIGLVRDVVGERMSFRQAARLEIENSWTGPQRVVGPLLVVPYVREQQVSYWDAEQQRHRTTLQQNSERLIVLPEQLRVQGDVQTEERRLGLYKVPVYTAALDLQGRFGAEALERVAEVEEGTTDRIVWERPFLSVTVGDLRGVISQPTMRWGDQAVVFDSGSGLGPSVPGMHAELDPAPLATAEEGAVSRVDRDLLPPPEALADIDFSLDFVLRGMETIRFAPVGRDTRVELESPWPHPSFVGRYLPARYETSAAGFTSSWQASSFSSGMAGLADQCADGTCTPLVENTFGVSLVNTVDIYQQAERSLKYALLFLVLTFGFFFLYEVLKRMAVHPVQYLLVGLALSVFYLLLVSLSEHVAFAWAYLGAAVACSTLLGSYVGSILHSVRRGGLFFTVVSGLYGVLYVILQSEDNALLMGSLLIFGVLATAMLATRRVDWYQVGTRPPESP